MSLTVTIRYDPDQTPVVCVHGGVPPMWSIQITVDGQHITTVQGSNGPQQCIRLQDCPDGALVVSILDQHGNVKKCATKMLKRGSNNDCDRRDDVIQTVNVQCGSGCAPQACPQKCVGKPYKFNPRYAYSRLIDAAKLKSMLDADTAKKIVLVAVPFHPQGGYYWTPSQSVGVTPFANYIKYATPVPVRTYQSIQFDWRSDLCDITEPRYYDLPAKAAFEATLTAKGLAKDSIIVLYDDTKSAPASGITGTSMNRMATRALFVLEYFGHQNVFLLDGGDQEWLASGGAVDATPVVPVATPAPGYQISVERKERIIEIAGVQRERVNPCSVVLDARPYTMYVGTAAGGIIQSGLSVSRRGHIHKAVNAPWSEYLRDIAGNANNNNVTYKKFKLPADLDALFVDSKVIVDNKLIVAACNEGIHAVFAWFAIDKLLNYDNVLVYEGSTAEWADAGGLIGAEPQDLENYPMLTGSEDL